MLCTKRAHQCTIFRLLGALMMKVHPILHAIVETTRSGFFSAIRYNSFVFFQLKPNILWTKIAHRSEIFGLLSGWVKIHQIPHVIFGTTS